MTTLRTIAVALLALVALGASEAQARTLGSLMKVEKELFDRSEIVSSPVGKGTDINLLLRGGSDSYRGEGERESPNRPEKERKGAKSGCPTVCMPCVNVCGGRLSPASITISLTVRVKVDKKSRYDCSVKTKKVSSPSRCVCTGF